MDELINRVAQSADIPEEKARKAIEMVLTEVKERLPAALADDIDQQIRHGRNAPIVGGADAVVENLRRSASNHSA